MTYREVSFSIDCRGYIGNSGWQSDLMKRMFRTETRRLFGEMGWVLQEESDIPACSDTVIKGNQQLYLHPTVFTGVVEMEDLPLIERALDHAGSFRYLGYRVYREYEELDDDAYWARLESQRPEIEKAILTQFSTKRRNLFVLGTATQSIVDRFTIHRVCDKEGHRNKANLFVGQLVDEMIADGRLVVGQTRNGPGLRARTTSEGD